MSLSKLNKLFFISCLLLIPGSFVKAKTVSFNDKQWDIPTTFAQTTPAVFIRNDFDLLQLTQAAVMGSSLNGLERLFSPETITNIEDITEKINQPAKDASLIIENNKATQFDPGQNGQALDLYVLKKLLLQNINDIHLPVMVSRPKIALADTNALGIKELVATGQSNFSGSPSNRIHNITVGAARFNGLIIQPGAEFSFNKYLGEVDGDHDFLPELVIKPEGVTPEFGGGLCQVSSTTFRAAMNAGLPITARRNHSFAVQYYAPQGTDATIYPGSSDLKFINNLPSVMLIRTRIEGKKLFFDFFGTKDNRVVTFEGPNQYDKKPDGSMKAIWTRHVTLNNQTTDQTFKSVYLPPAQFHHDTPETLSQTQ